MGHIHLQVLPGSLKWRQVVDLLGSEAANETVFAASAIAAEGDLARAADDPVFVEAVRLLLMIPFSARSDDFGLALRDCDLSVGSTPDLFEICAGASERLDDIARAASRRTDFGELAGRALIGTLNDQIGAALPGLFEATDRDVQIEAQRLSRPNGIAALSRAFFGRLLSDSLSYWLDRTLAMQTGTGRRLPDVGARSAFDVALQTYTQEATRIIQEFAPGWYGKRLYEDGRIESPQAAAFAAVAMKKITEELRRKRDADA
ncbi:hypothetical protein MLD63_16685 [Paracoccus sp. TK19116]|uniref:Uncharacterized protein n=1 Tax=Paracoccus albicereus TaxID=2922394 RepID=A0ABT1MUN4_9RHOB|nr:hypothetical protein [Paracoccus albicereus]MCQ0972057.1 hypothetical protein [Paracoccus albicereus]